MIVRWILVGSALCTALFSLRSTQAADAVLRFDCGTADSPLADGYRRVTAETRYTPQAGFGWVSPADKRSDFYRQAISPNVVWKDELPATLADGVASATDLVFRADVPNGRYRVEVLLGDLGGEVPAGMGRFLDTGVRGEQSGGPGGPLYSMAVESNGQRQASNIETRTLPHRGTVGCQHLLEALSELKMPIEARVRLGNYARITFDDTVTDGKLVLKFCGDQSQYNRVLSELLVLTDPIELRRRMHTASGPFSRNSVLAMAIYPALPEPLVEDAGKLKAAEGQNALLQQFAEAFNQCKLAEARDLVERLPQGNSENVYARLLAKLWLIGHPNHWRERELVVGLADEIAAAARTADAAERERLRHLGDLLYDFEWGVRNYDQRAHDGQETIPSMNRAEGYFARSRPGEPFYWKSQLYRARAWYSMDPNRNSLMWPKSQEIVEQLDKAYPGNRWADFYLRKDPGGWPLVDYRTQTASAPLWASELHAYYNRMLDLCQWWIDHRQDPYNGAVGGEWGDDVEFMPWLGYMGFVCPDAAPQVFDGVLHFCEGAWSKSGIVDNFNGFFHITSDAEHSSEFTGNVLGMMPHLRPGDPEYVERALKTAKLMRDLWMGRNVRGQRQFRSSYLGAFHVPLGIDQVDSAICNRALLPALNVMELNRNPEIIRLIVEYADTLLALAKSTDKGKPEWVVPGPIVFDTGELGHAGSSEWWLAPEGTFQQMFSFPDYHGFRLQILSNAWRLTGNQSYLEPIRHEAELAATSPVESPEEKKERLKRKAAAKLKGEKDPLDLPEGSLAWTARELRDQNVLAIWDGIQAELQAAAPIERGVLLEKDAVAKKANELSEVARKRWPMMTDDATMTDRVLFGGCVDPVIWYSGARMATQQILPAVSYEGPGRDFAALVLKHNPRYLKLLYYGFHDAPRRVRLRFWELQPGGTYSLTYGIDSNGDDTIDREPSSQEFTLREPSGGIDLELAPGQTYVVEVSPVRLPTAPEQMIDPAIAPRDVQYDPRGHLLVDVHNLGNQPVENLTVSFYEGHAAGTRRLLGRTIVSYIEPGNRLEPQVVRTGIEWFPSASEQQITVVLDEEGRLDELFERNNEARVLLPARGQPLPGSAPRRHKGDVVVRER